MRKEISYLCILLCCGSLVYLVLDEAWKYRRHILSGQEPLSITNNDTRNDSIVQPCEEHRHVAFLKVHKAGSTTVMNILQRFGEKRSLICAIPKNANYLGKGTTIEDDKLMKIPNGTSYNLLYNHVVYNRTAFRRIMPENTVYVAIVREPLDLLDSAIIYYQYTKYIVDIPEIKLVNFLANPRKFEPLDHRLSFTNNRMAYDFGLSPQLFHDREAIQNHLLSVSEDFDIVLLLEYFDESLILLKRKLCWNFEDILYVKNNANHARSKIPFSKEIRKAHKAWAIADNMFYDFFHEKFWKTVRQESLDFITEVKEFKIVSEYVRSFCQKFNLNSNLQLVVEKTDFSSEFNVSYNDCKLMKMPELDFMQLTRNRHLKAFKESNHSRV